MDTLFQRQVAHLAQWAQNPGTLDYARQRSLELEACESGLWQGLRAAVRDELGRARASASGDQSATRRP